jgi:hypothetical protein
MEIDQGKRECVGWSPLKIDQGNFEDVWAGRT